MKLNVIMGLLLGKLVVEIVGILEGELVWGLQQ